MATTSGTPIRGNGGAGRMATLVATVALALGLLIGGTGGQRALAAGAPPLEGDCPLTTAGLCLGQWSSPAADSTGVAEPAIDCPLITPGMCLGQWTSPPSGAADGPANPVDPEVATLAP